MKKALLGLTLLFAAHPAQAWDCSWLLNKLQSKPAIITIVSVAACAGIAWWIMKTTKDDSQKSKPTESADLVNAKNPYQLPSITNSFEETFQEAENGIIIQAMANIYNLNIVMDDYRKLVLYQPNQNPIIFIHGHHKTLPNLIGIAILKPSTRKKLPYYKIFNPSNHCMMQDSIDLSNSIYQQSVAEFECLRHAMKKILNLPATDIPTLEDLQAKVSDHIKSNPAIREQIKLIEVQDL